MPVKTNAYAQFAQFMKPELERRHGRMSFQAAISQTAIYWDALSPEERQFWKEKAASSNTDASKSQAGAKKSAPKKKPTKVPVTVGEGVDPDSEDDEPEELVMLMTKKQRRLHDEYQSQAERQNAVLARYFNVNEFQMIKHVNDNNDAIKKYVFSVPSKVSIEDCRKKVLQYRHAVLHMVPYYYKKATSHSLTPLEISLAIFSCEEGFIKSKTWHLDWLKINPQRAAKMQNRTIYATPHKLPPVFEESHPYVPRVYGDLKEVVDEMENMMEWCGGKFKGGDILINGEMETYNRVEGCLQTLREEYFDNEPMTPETRLEELLLARSRLRCFDSVLDALVILTMDQPTLSKHPMDNNVWHMHVLPSIVAKHKDKPNIIRYCGYHGDADHPDHRPDRVSACSLATVKLMAYHMMYEVSQQSGMHEFMDINDPKYHPGGGSEGVADEIWRNPNYVDPLDPESRALREALKPPAKSVMNSKAEYARLAEEDKRKDPTLHVPLLPEAATTSQIPLQQPSQLREVFGSELEKRRQGEAETVVRRVEPAYSVYGGEASVRQRALPPISAAVAAAAAPLLPPRVQPPSSSVKARPATLPPSVTALLDRRRNVDLANESSGGSPKPKDIRGFGRGAPMQ